MNANQVEYQEKTMRAANGLGILLLNIVLMIAAVALQTSCEKFSYNLQKRNGA